MVFGYCYQMLGLDLPSGPVYGELPHTYSDVGVNSEPDPPFLVLSHIVGCVFDVPVRHLAPGVGLFRTSLKFCSTW